MSYSIYKEDITRWPEDMNFLFEWLEQYLTDTLINAHFYNYMVTKVHFVHYDKPTCLTKEFP